MPDKPQSFLASVKEEVTDAFAESYDELVDITTDEDKLGTSLKTVQKKVWEIVERRLKESYRNGQNAGPRKEGNGKPRSPVDLPPETKKSNPFRKS